MQNPNSARLWGEERILMDIWSGGQPMKITELGGGFKGGYLEDHFGGCKWVMTI